MKPSGGLRSQGQILAGVSSFDLGGHRANWTAAALQTR